MRKSLQCVAIALALFLLLSSGAFASPAVSTEAPVITTAHVYPVVPGSAEWSTYYGPEQKLAASYVDPCELARMSTAALVETVMTYPLLGDMFAFDTLETGIGAVSTRFAGIRELSSRPDAAEELRAYRHGITSTGRKADLARYCADALLKHLQQVNGSVTPDVGILATSSYVTTPNGTRVPTIMDLTWAELGTTYDEQLAWAYYYCETYPSAYILYNPAPKYNCHSYAWYWASTSNRHWMNSPSAYMSDGSYISWTCIVGAKVFYDSAYGSNYDHSGIVQTLPSGGAPARIRSKWGCNATFSHYVNDCVYMNYSPLITFWKRP